MPKSAGGGTPGNPRRVGDRESRSLSACLIHESPNQKTSKKILYFRLRYTPRQITSKSRQYAVFEAGTFGDMTCVSKKQENCEREMMRTCRARAYACRRASKRASSSLKEQAEPPRKRIGTDMTETRERGPQR